MAFAYTQSVIASASDFLAYFRQLPRAQQDKIAPHLNEPEQLALKVLNACSEVEGQLVGAIASLAELHPESARAILKTLQGKIVMAEATLNGKSWKLL